MQWHAKDGIFYAARSQLLHSEQGLYTKYVAVEFEILEVAAKWNKHELCFKDSDS